MAGIDKKKKPSIIFFIVAFVAVVIVMLVANWQSALEEEIYFPFNNGVVNLSTYKSSLVAVSHDNQIYVWDWSNLSKKYEVVAVESDQGALLKSGLVISVKRRSPRAVVITDLKSGEKHKEIPVDSDNEVAYLGVNRNQSAIALMLAKRQNDKTAQARYRFLVVNADSGRIEPVAEITEEAADSRLTNLAVSDDGEYIVAVGEKNGSGWMVLVNVEQKRVMWEETLPEVNLFFKSVFSADGKVVYARGSNSTLYKIEKASGKILDRLLPVKKNKSTLKHSSSQVVAVSPDGRLVAAIVFSTVYVWDCGTGEKIFSVTPGHKIESGIAFSPDCRFLATSDMRQGGTVKIWRMPGR